MPRADVNGISIHYELEGPKDGPVVVLSNSLACNLGMWDPQVPALTGAGYRVLRHDSRGHGQSDAPAGPYTIELLADDARALLDALGLDRVHFCGLSKGGMVGQRLAADHGDRLRSLSLCATASHMPQPDMWDARIATARERGMAGVADATVERWFTEPFRRSHPDAVERVRRMILDTPVEGYAGCCLAIRDMDLREAIGSIDVPTLILVGREDPSTPPAAAQAIHERIRGSELVIVPEAAHLLNIQQTELFNRKLLEFLGARS